MTTSLALPIAIRGLSKSFGPKQVLKGIDLELPPGTVLGLLGSNGAGKTTLLKCLLGLLAPTSGQAHIFGENAWDLSAETKTRLGYVPQEVATYPWMRVRHVIDYTAAFYPSWNKALVADLCQRWKLPLEDRSGALSVGQLQTLGIVLALGHEPQLLILDEPVASLDPSARREFLRTLINMVEHPERTVLFSTHITSDLERVANRIALVRDGRIEFSGDLDTLKERVKRIRMLARDPLPEAFGVAGAIDLEVEGRHATFTTPSYSLELVAELEQTWEAEVSVTDLNLEEIFVELHKDVTPGVDNGQALVAGGVR